MLGLKLATDPRWVNIVESNIEEILTDHAWCEQKAASNAIYIIVNNSEKEEFDEVWEQAIYRICYVKERYRAKADNISRLFTFMFN